MNKQLLFITIFLPFTLWSQILKNKQEVIWNPVGKQFPIVEKAWHRAYNIAGIGQVQSIWSDPDDINHLIVGTNTGGVWETHNAMDAPGLIHWEGISKEIPVFTASRILVAQGKVYTSSSSITSGDLISSKFRTYGLGVAKKKLGDHTPWQISGFTFDCTYFDLYTKGNQKLLYAISRDKVFKSTDDAQTWEELTAFNKIRRNRGTFLQRILINPENPDEVLIFTRNSKELLFKTSDAGKTWEDISLALTEKIPRKLSEYQLSTKPYYDKQSQTLYIAVHSATKAFVFYTKNWRDFFPVDTGENKGYYTSSMRRSAFLVDADTIFYGATYLHKIIPGLRIEMLSNRKIHDDIRDLVLRKYRGKSMLFVATDGGIFLTKDFGKTFVNISGDLQVFEAFNMAYNRIKNQRIITIGTQDDGWYQINRDTDNQWHQIPLCCEGSVMTQKDDPQTIYFINKGNLQRTDDGLHYPLRYKSYGNLGRFDAVIAQHPEHPESIVFTKGYRLFTSKNKGENAVNISIKGSEYIKGNASAMAFSKNHSDTFYVATAFRPKNPTKEQPIQNHLYKTTNFNDSIPNIAFTDLIENLRKYDAGVLDKDFITDIEVHDDKPDTIWICFANLQNAKKVYQSDDGGLTWQNISYNLPNAPVNRIAYDYAHQMLFAGTDYGVFYLRNKRWNRYGKGLPLSIISGMAFDPISKEIMVSSFGNGVWSASTDIAAFKDVVITQDTEWHNRRKINGDLMVKNGATLTLNHARIFVKNIIVEEGATLQCKNSTLQAHRDKALHSSFVNGQISVEKNARWIVENSKISHYQVHAASPFSVSAKDNSYENVGFQTDNDDVLQKINRLVFRMFR